MHEFTASFEIVDLGTDGRTQRGAFLGMAPTRSMRGEGLVMYWSYALAKTHRQTHTIVSFSVP